MSMPAISLHQPWASLCVTRQPTHTDWDMIHGHNFGYDQSRYPMVKRLETRSWPCPPNLIGQRIALHATKRKPKVGRYDYGRILHAGGGDPAIYGAQPKLSNGQQRCWQPPGHDSIVNGPVPVMLPLGAIIGSAVVEACYPIVGEHDHPLPKPWIERTDQNLLHLVRWDGWSDISDQLPYGTYEHGRHAWLLADAAPVQERCPWCRGEVYSDEDGEHGCRVKAGETPISGGTWSAWVTCPVCDGVGRCEPIPAKGHQRIWRWEP